jgi:hypothetical protein
MSLAEAGKRLADTTAHDLRCRFTGCNCGAVQELQTARADFLRIYRTMEMEGKI